MSTIKRSVPLPHARHAQADSTRLRSALGGANRYALSTGLALVVLVIWQGVTFFFDIPRWLLPSPWQTLAALGDSPGLIFRHAAVTAREALAGFALSVVFGFGLGVAISHSRLVEKALYPYVIASQAIPVIAIAPILVVWLGFGMLPKVIVIVLITFFPITINTVDGLRNVDPEMATLMRSLGASRWQHFRMVQLPSALPLIFSGARIAAAVSVIGAILGEWVGASEGLGYLITRSSAQFLTARVFASVLILSLMGIALFYAVSLVERVATPWSRRDAAAKGARERR